MTDIDLVRALEQRCFNAWPTLRTLHVDGWVLRLAARALAPRATFATWIAPIAASVTTRRVCAHVSQASTVRAFSLLRHARPKLPLTLTFNNHDDVDAPQQDPTAPVCRLYKQRHVDDLWCSTMPCCHCHLSLFVCVGVRSDDHGGIASLRRCLAPHHAAAQLWRCCPLSTTRCTDCITKANSSVEIPPFC